jgi:hypothetical protein
MAETVYVFKVALAGTKDIWRRIAVRPSQTLDDLHEAIYAAFDRWDEHMYSFFFPARPTTNLRKIYDSPEYTHPYNAENPDPFHGERIPNAAKTRLNSLGLAPKQRFYYLFDFGDSWWHEVTVESLDAAAEKGRYPCVIEKHGDSPSQYPDEEDEEAEEEDEDEEEEEEEDE